MLDIVHQLKYIWYTQLSGGWLYPNPQVITYHYSEDYFVPYAKNICYGYDITGIFGKPGYYTNLYTTETTLYQGIRDFAQLYQ